MGVDIQTYRAKIGTYRHSNGVDVVTLVLVVNFSRGLKTIGSVLFIGLLLVMAGIEKNPGPRDHDSASEQSDEVPNTDIPMKDIVTEAETPLLMPTKIQLSGLSENFNKELLEMVFENEERHGGGKVKEVKVCGEKNSALIEFEEASAVEFIMQNLPLSILGTEVLVEVIETEFTEENMPPKTIKVAGLPKGITGDILTLFFENENRQGGGKVVDVTIDRDRNSAIVEFEEVEAVDKVMGKRPISLLGTEVDVEVFVPVSKCDNVQSTKLRVRALSPNITPEVLTLFFENENRQGGGRVKEVTLDAAGKSAVVEFEEATALEVVMAKQPIRIFGTIVEIEVIEEDETNLKQPKSRTINVSGLPKNTQEEMLTMFFENEKRQGGGKVANVFINEKEGSALVEFEEDKAVENVLGKQPIIFLGCEVKVERYVPPEHISSEVESTKLLVTNIPENVTDEILVMFFENEKRQGGGNVKHVTIDKENRCAIVEFEEAKAIDKVLQKRPIIIMGTEVSVDVFDGKYPQKKQNTMLVVSGLPRDMSVDFLTMFFENEKRFGGGPVKNVEIKEDTNSAIIDFEEPEAVTIVMKKQPIIIQGTEVHISTFVLEPDTEPSKGTQLKVSRLPEKISQEYLVMFFENEQRQGGGKVKSVEINEVTRSAIIQFEEEKAVEVVLQKRPIMIQNKEVAVETVCTEPPIESSRIKVSYLPSGVTEDYLVLFFENERRYGGGPVKHIEIDQIKNFAIVEFEEQQAVLKVLEKKPIALLGQNVTVEIFDEEPNVMLVSGLPDDITEEFLVMFFENQKRQGGGNVKTVEINFNRSLAIIEFETSDSLKKVLEKRPILISGKECEISVFNGSSTVEVRGYTADKSSEKQLLRYFENTELSGGENVQSIRVNKDTGVTLVSFLRHEVVKRVLERKHHTLNQSTLIINTYVPTSTSSECKHIPKTEIVYSRDQAQDSSNSLCDENSRTLSEGKSPEGKIQEYNTSQAADTSSSFYDEKTEVPSAQNSSESKMQEHAASQTTDCLKFNQVLEKLGLTDKYPGKISIKDVIAIDPDEANDQEKQVLLSDIPWVMLKRLISAHSDARDITSTNGNNIEPDFDSTLSFLSDVPDESEDLSPLDTFSVVFQCCDPLMKQIFFQKLYLCKMAVPFLYQSWVAQGQTPVVSVWPLRYLAIENKTTSMTPENKFSSKEVDMLELSSKVLTFARFGRPRYSKSKLLNSLLSTHGCKTFFNIDCPSGMTPRYLSNGQIEMFWLPTIGDKKDKFEDAVTFLNMRGDLNEHFTPKVCNFTAKFADAIAIVIDLYSIRKEKDAIKRHLIQFASVILIIANPLKQEDVLIVQDFERDVKTSRNDISLRVLSTHKGTIEQNVVDMVSTLCKHISSQLKSCTLRSLHQRLSEALNGSLCIRTDEEEADCQHGKEEAEKLIKQMNRDGKPRMWKHVLTPVHSKYSKLLGKLKKKREREKGLTEGENIEREMTDIRKRQTESVTSTVKCFVTILTNNPGSYIKLKMVLGWLHFFIEREKRRILPQLMYENRRAWEQLKVLKGSKETKTPGAIEKQEKLITDLEGKIDDASFSVEHFFREIGHIYEAILVLGVNASDVGLPEIDKIANVVGRLVADGHQLELIDGESFYMPFRWTQKVLQHVDNAIGSSRIMTLSVLGLQSSGKSTLLNTMFGSQFSTRTGRCTRGIHIQLVPANTKKYASATSRFDYVLVVDTEGLRSPELSHIQHEHDNELATVITGLGDITMLNIMGENTSEIRDILQVVVHAFLRLKMTNQNLDIRKSCTFIHQNVTDTSASDNMISGLSKLMQTLDAMTEESAKSEGILEITTFNQVIEFDINTQVWYLKNLWQGNPPMARVNTEYSERVVDMKCRILKKALNMENKSYKSISDILEQAHSLWKGVLNEDFVFSFRNSLEIRAYMEMEMFVLDHLWQLESFIRERLIEKSQSKFSDCDQKEKLRAIADEVISDLKDLLSEEKTRKEKEISRYFEINKYKDIIIQWKTTQQGRVDILCSKLERTIKEQIEKKYIKRSVEILTISSHEKHEEELRKKSMEVANKYKGKQLRQAQKDKLFAEIWNSFINKIDTNGCTTDTIRKPMKTIFIDCLKHFFEKHGAVLKDSLNASSQLTPLQGLEMLSGSFEKTGIDEKDIGFSLIQKGTEFLMITDAMAHITTRVNHIFLTMDDKIKQICQLNDEITEMNVNKLLHDLQKSIHDILMVKKKYDFKPTFKVKVYIHLSRYAHPIFEKHNEDYFKTKGVVVRLEQYKQQQKISFEAHLNNRASEDIVAQLFSNVIEEFAKEWTLENIPNKVTDDLHSYLPSLKNRVIIEICNSLLAEENFYEFISYLIAPNDYASVWISKRATSRLFDKESDAYFNIAKNLVNGVFGNAEVCLGKVKDKFGDKPISTITIDEWVNEFIFLSKDGQLPIPVESFRNVRKEVTIIENIQYLTDVILANMLESKDKVINEFRMHNRYTVMWTNVNPIERITRKIWGCPEQCPFCGEPCAKNEDHEGDQHYSIQHRPSCCNGVQQTSTEKACIETCGFDVNSDTKHTCEVFDFACNKENREPCHNKMHSYREYKEFFPNWDIPPSSNMGDSSKFWMWFVATYQIKLCSVFKYRLDHLPTSWKEIKKDQAKESLTKTYTA